eukprot:CAMPEP_0183355098 /NCGR_PEP_ID=MMETSP0164_2-20130417/39157_1 /TAXON_ID=221442 /ORGANISM="Coccolithus pelagicus ssp braarudi, Strain PLY182g" /LENGTH=118 /DNA_ID=CAMNT_0025528115 /DNA_START=584 /DNA_END=937 /DNA_ORIENTATION=+
MTQLVDAFNVLQLVVPPEAHSAASSNSSQLSKRELDPTSSNSDLSSAIVWDVSLCLNARVIRTGFDACSCALCCLGSMVTADMRGVLPIARACALDANPSSSSIRMMSGVPGSFRIGA